MNTRIAWVGVVILAVLSAVLGFKLQQKPREVIKEVPVEVVKTVEKPVEVIKEVPVEVIKEVIKEVPVEVVKTVEKPIPAEYAFYRERGLKFQNARYVPSAEKLRGVKSIYLTVNLPDALKDNLSEEAIKGKIELELRQLGIEVASQPSATNAWLSYTIEVFKDEARQTLAYITSLNLLGEVYVARDREIFKTMALIWTSGNFGVVDLTNAKNLGNAYEGDLSAFSSSYQQANAKK